MLSTREEEIDMEASLLLGAVIGKAYQNQPKRDDDYIGKDGLMYCGNCRTPKQKELTLDQFPPKAPKTVKVPVMCKCREAEYKQEEADRKKREDMARIEKLKKNSLMDEKFRRTTFDTFEVIKENARVHKICTRYAENFGEMVEKNQGLLFYGPVGTGKSFAAACIANYLLDQMTPVVMTSFVKILQNVQSFKEEEEQKFINRMNGAKLLIIDDLGAERNTDFALEKVYNIIDSRYRAKMPLVLTTNLSLKQMQETMDIRYARIYDRIFEMCYPVEYLGPSWRKDEAARRFDEMTKFLEGEK